MWQQHNFVRVQNPSPSPVTVAVASAQVSRYPRCRHRCHHLQPQPGSAQVLRVPASRCRRRDRRRRRRQCSCGVAADSACRFVRLTLFIGPRPSVVPKAIGPFELASIDWPVRFSEVMTLVAIGAVLLSTHHWSVWLSALVVSAND